MNSTIPPSSEKELAQAPTRLPASDDCTDTISPPPPLSGRNLIIKSSFEDGTWAPWWTHYVYPGHGYPSVQDGAFCFTLTSNAVKPWDAQFHHGHMVAQKDHVYSISFSISSSKRTSVYAIAGHPEPPYREYWRRRLVVDEREQLVRGAFVMQADGAPFELAFAMGGELSAGIDLPVTIRVRDVHVDDPMFVPVEEPPARPVSKVLVNQLGYFPQFSKIAVVRSSVPARWELLDRAGQVVLSGATRSLSVDPASADELSIADFSAFRRSGNGFSLRVGADTSCPFTIRDDLYRRLKYQALSFFYHQRSGIAIEMPYAGDPAWTRPAGHVNAGHNRGDLEVVELPGGNSSYALDVSGGWYDNDLHDKSMWVSAFAIWTLLNFWERTLHFGSSCDDYGDGKLNIPEAGNGVPDLLDEVRWGVEFVLSMRVPQGHPLAGMCHHGVRDEQFTDLGTAPHQDPQPRYLLPPSTAATLALAANAAQSARVWRSIDAAFSARCLAAAEAAWTAAVANPGLLFEAGLGGYDSGGGDRDVEDDFYWAAAELYVTTGDATYLEFLRASPHFGVINSRLPEEAQSRKGATPMNWHRVAALGSISLAVVPNQLQPEELRTIRKNVVEATKGFLEIANREGYRIPLEAEPSGYPWASNWELLNILLVIGLAFDFSGDPRFLNAVVLGADYILGRNAMDTCYVTGVGPGSVRFPHHRFFAFQADSRYPKAPPGLLSGGPNSGLEDQYVQGLGLRGRPPAKCFVDHSASFSTNGVSISWNASLAWVLGFLDEHGRRDRSGARKAPSIVSHR